MKNIAKNTIGTVIGGICLAFLFFVWNDYIYKSDNLTGAWTFVPEVEETSYSPYQDMKLYFDVLIIQQGNKIIGTGEKIKEITKNSGEFVYPHKERVHIEVQGNIEYKFFSKNIVKIHFKEKGKIRDSSTIQSIVLNSNNQMTGTYLSTVANIKGNVRWKRRES